MTTKPALRMASIRKDAEKAVNERGRYTITIERGFMSGVDRKRPNAKQSFCRADMVFSIRQYGRHGYVLKQGEDVVSEYPTPSQVITELCEQVQSYM